MWKKSFYDPEELGLPQVMTIMEVSEVFRVTERAVVNLVKTGQIPAPIINSGTIRRWSRAEVMAALRGKPE